MENVDVAGFLPVPFGLRTDNKPIYGKNDTLIKVEFYIVCINEIMYQFTQYVI